jgi:hypothetical protein
MLLISDANILIDMADGGLLEKMSRLPEKFAVPDVLFHVKKWKYGFHCFNPHKPYNRRDPIKNAQSVRQH